MQTKINQTMFYEYHVITIMLFVLGMLLPNE